MESRILILKDEPTRKRCLAILSALSLERPWQVELSEYHQKRSTAQNARLWALHTKAAAVVGCSPDDLHEEMLCRHFGSNEYKLGGKIMRFPLKRSSTRNVKEFREFLDYVENFYIAELGVWLE